MSEEEIKDNPSLRKLRDDAELLGKFGKLWPSLRQLAGLLGVDTVSIDKTLDETRGLPKRIHEMTAVPDRFNDLFSDRGWILFESMELEAAQQAIEIAENDGIDKADEFLVQHFSPAWVEDHIHWLGHLKGFPERFVLAKLALEDYKAGRFYASVLATLSLVDGWVNELNIIDFRREGFFSDQSQLVAWDSIAAHPKGLVRLQRVFGIPRKMTRTEEIRIPYRHGIMHGMDLGYNNEYVAAKCWAALFAVRDWVIKAAKGELDPPELAPKVEKTLWESIESYRRTVETSERIKEWQPRCVVVGESIPPAGHAEDYPPNTPEKKTVEFLNYWLKDNYGYMARCYAPILDMQPVGVKERFQGWRLLDFELMEVNDVTPAMADIKVKAHVMRDGQESSLLWEFRLIASNREGDWVHIQSDDTVWGVTTWRTAQ